MTEIEKMIVDSIRYAGKYRAVPVDRFDEFDTDKEAAAIAAEEEKEEIICRKK